VVITGILFAFEACVTRLSHPGHDPIAVADAGAALDEVQLEAAHIFGRRRVGRAFEPE